MSPPSHGSVIRSRLRNFKSTLHAGDRCACCLYTFSPFKTIVRVDCNERTVQNLLRFLRLDERDDWKVQQKDGSDQIKLCDGCERSLDEYGKLSEKVRQNYDLYEANQKRSDSRNAIGSISGENNEFHEKNTDASRRDSVESRQETQINAKMIKETNAKIHTHVNSKGTNKISEDNENSNIEKSNATSSAWSKESHTQNESTYGNRNKHDMASRNHASQEPHVKSRQKLKIYPPQMAEYEKAEKRRTSDATKVQETDSNKHVDESSIRQNSPVNAILKPNESSSIEKPNKFTRNDSYGKQNIESQAQNESANHNNKDNKSRHNSNKLTKSSKKKQEKSPKHGSNDERSTKTPKDDGNKKDKPKHVAISKSFAASTKESTVQPNENLNKISNKNVSVARKDENISSIPENKLASCESAKVKKSEHLKELKNRSNNISDGLTRKEMNCSVSQDKTLRGERTSKKLLPEQTITSSNFVENQPLSLPIYDLKSKTSNSENINIITNDSMNTSSEDNKTTNNVERERGSATISGNIVGRERGSATISGNIVGRERGSATISGNIVGSEALSVAIHDLNHTITKITDSVNINVTTNRDKRSYLEDNIKMSKIVESKPSFSNTNDLNRMKPNTNNSDIVNDNSKKDESTSKNTSSEDNNKISNIVRSKPSSSTKHDLNHSKPNTTSSENINVNVNRDELCSKNTSSEDNIKTSIIVGSKPCSLARQDLHSITPIATNHGNINAIKRDGKRTLTENIYEENAKKARVENDRSITVPSDITIARRISQDNTGPSSQAGRTKNTPVHKSIVEYVNSSSDDDSDDDTIQTQTKWIATVHKDENEDTMELPIHNDNDCELINDEEMRPIIVEEKEIDEDLMNKESEQIVELKSEVTPDKIMGCIDLCNLDEISLSDSNIRRDIEILPDDEPLPAEGLKIEHNSSSIQHRNQETPSCLETRTLRPFPLSPTTLEPPEASTQLSTLATQLPMTPTQLPILIIPSDSSRLPTIIPQPSASSTTAHLDSSGWMSHSEVEMSKVSQENEQSSLRSVDQPSGSVAAPAVASAPLFPPIKKRKPKYGTIRGQEVYLGYDVWILLSLLEDAKNSKTSMVFIRKMLEAIWTIDVLGRMPKGEPLDKKKLDALKTTFIKWLRKRIPRDKVKDEIEKFDKLVKDAKSTCRKKFRKLNNIPPGKRNKENPEEEREKKVSSLVDNIK